MNKYNNDHLNIFHHYQQNGSIPIENNISRGLAIVFQEYPAFFMMFLNAIEQKEKEHKRIPWLNGEYIVSFQKRIHDFEYSENIIGVTLTAKEGLDDLPNDNIRESTDNPITDISIEYSDTVIIIEVKRKDEDCTEQLNEQIKRLEDNITDEGDIEKYWANFTWTDILVLLEQYFAVNSKEERLIQDYYNHVCYCYPEWLPVKAFSDIPQNNVDQQYKRIEQVTNKYNKDNNLPANNYIDLSGRISWASELHIWMDDQSDSINFGIWPSNKSSQYYALKYKSDFSFLSVKSDLLSISVFVKIYDSHGRQKHRISLVKGAVENEKLFEDLCENIRGQWKRSASSKSWEEFERRIQESSAISNNEKQQFNVFYRDLKNSNMNVFNAILSCEIIKKVPYQTVQEIDKDRNDISECIKLIGDSISEMISLVETKD